MASLEAKSLSEILNQTEPAQTINTNTIIHRYSAEHKPAAVVETTPPDDEWVIISRNNG